MLGMGLTVALTACGTADPVSTDVPWTAPNGGVIELTTTDSVTLEADYYPASAVDRPAIVLLHMVPPSNTRADWPAPFIAELTSRDWTVIAVDRRGAGGSDGNPADSYIGPGGRLDVAAAVQRITDDGYTGKLALIGASNGTTSVLDYAVDPPVGLPAVAVMGFLTGGSYTEAQNAMSSVSKVPAFFTYSTMERAWSEAQRPVDEASWAFYEYPGGAHGTRMFTVGGTVTPAFQADILGFLDANL